MTLDAQTLESIRDAGRDHGKGAASWYFDGNTSQETYEAVLRGIDDGDPVILDTLPHSPLSGEWADDPTPTTLARDFELAEEDVDEACEAYEDGFYEAVHAEIERVARYHAAPTNG